MAYQVSYDTRANWVAANRTPLLGEECFETDTYLRKMGDGATAYNSLPYATVASSTPPADGQLLVWSATTNQWSPVSPTGASELAAGVNNSNVGIPLIVQDYGGTSQTTLSGTGITVPPSNGRPVTLEWDGLAQQGVSGSGEMWISLYTNGSTSTALSMHVLPVATGIAVSGSLGYLTFHGAFRVGVISTSTNFSLSAMVYQVSSANSPAVTILPLPNAPLMLRALAG